MNKSIKIMGILLFLSMVLITSGVTLALFVDQEETSENLITAGKVKMSYTEATNALELTEAIPTTLSEGMNQNDYFEFSVTSYATTDENDNIGLEVPYEINITPIEVAVNYQALTREEVNVGLSLVENNQEKNIKIANLGNLSTSNLRNDSYMLYDVKEHFKNNSGEKTSKYRLRMWIDEDVEQEKFNLADYEYRIKVNVDSRVKPVSNTLTFEQRCFSFDSSTGVITDFLCYKGNTTGLDEITDLVIPSSINGVNVTTIDGGAFSNKNLTSVVIPETVTGIGSQAFSSNDLKLVNFGKFDSSFELFPYIFCENYNLSNLYILSPVKVDDTNWNFQKCESGHIATPS